MFRKYSCCYSPLYLLVMDFYLKLDPISRFRDAAIKSSYTHVPEGWSIVITDIVNSTAAIAEGRYKEVNTTGALAIVALANQNIRDHIPFVFGGDGITMLCPPELVPKVTDTLHGVRVFVKEHFALDMRIGVVPVRDVLDAGYELLVGKMCESMPLQQALFYGEGFHYADQLVKSEGSAYKVPEDHRSDFKPDFKGFACPFLDVRSEKGSVMALIVKKGSHPALFEQTIHELLDLLGSEKDYYPLSLSNLRMGTTPSQLSVWATVAAGRKGGFMYRLKGIMFATFMRLYSLNKKAFREGAQCMPPVSDYRKFDGCLKMVVNCSDEKSARLKKWLQRKEGEGAIHFGLHESGASVVTCLFSGKPGKDPREMHLIDGANGGYTLAAKALKEKLRMADVAV